MEEFYEELSTTLKNIEEVHTYLLNNRLLRTNDLDTLNGCSEMIDSSKILIQNSIEKGEVID